MTDPIRPTDDEARAQARDLIAAARIAALGTLDDDGAPVVTRIAFGRDAQGAAMTLVSDLSQHSRAMARDPRVSLLLGEVAGKGDPLTHPRLTLLAQAVPVPRGGAEHAACAPAWLATHPKAKLYIGFADFGFVRFDVSAGLLNGGFGRAYRLSPADMGLQSIRTDTRTSPR